MPHTRWDCAITQSLKLGGCSGALLNGNSKQGTHHLREPMVRAFTVLHKEGDKVK